MGGVKRSSSRKIAISDFKGILANLSQFQPPPPHFQGGHNFCPIYIFCILVVSSFCRSFLDHNIICQFPLQKAVLGHYQHKHQQHHQHRNCDHPHRHHQQQHHQQCSTILIISKKQYLSTKSAKGDFWITLQRREIQTSHRKTLFSQILMIQQQKIINLRILWDQNIDLNET